jgi:hypothetical protein
MWLAAAHGTEPPSRLVYVQPLGCPSLDAWRSPGGREGLCGEPLYAIIAALLGHDSSLRLGERSSQVGVERFWKATEEAGVSLLISLAPIPRFVIQ